MIRVAKYETKIKNLYTYFEFVDYNSWDEFDKLLTVLTFQIGCRIIKKTDGIWSRHCILEKDGLIFQLMYHEDIGNYLNSQQEKDTAFYDMLGIIAYNTAMKLNETL